MIAQATHQMVEHATHHANFCAEAVKFHNGEWWERQVGRHQEKSSPVVLNEHEAQQAVNGFPEQIQTGIGDGGRLAIQA